MGLEFGPLPSWAPGRHFHIYIKQASILKGSGCGWPCFAEKNLVLFIFSPYSAEEGNKILSQGFTGFLPQHLTWKFFHKGQQSQQ